MRAQVVEGYGTASLGATRHDERVAYLRVTCASQAASQCSSLGSQTSFSFGYGLNVSEAKSVSRHQDDRRPVRQSNPPVPVPAPRPVPPKRLDQEVRADLPEDRMCSASFQAAAEECPADADGSLVDRDDPTVTEAEDPITELL